MEYLLLHAAALASLALILWLPGYALERAGLSDVPLGALRPLARVCLGLVSWTAATFVLASLGLLRAESVAVLAVVAAGAAGWTRARRGPAAQSGRRGDRAFVAALALVAIPFFLHSLSPHVTWDASAYHLTLPKRYVAAGGFVGVPMNVYSNWPLGTELLFALALLVGDHVVAKGVHLGFGLLTLWATYVGCRSLHRRASGWLAAPLVLANPIFAFELSVAYVDLAYAFFLTSAVIFMTRALAQGDDAKAALLLSGLCAGAVAGVKLSGVVGAACVGALALPRVVGGLRAGNPTPLRELALRFAAPVLALWLPWLAKSAAYTGNPVYPFLHGLLGGPDWSPTLAVQFRFWMDSYGMGRELVDYLLLPARVFLAPGGPRDPFHADLGEQWIVLVPVALLLGWRQPLARRSLAAAALYFCAWSLGAQQARFLIPMLPLLAMAASIGVVELLARIPKPRARRAALASAPGLALALALVLVHRPATAGLRLLPRLLESPAALHASAVHPIYAFVAAELPPDARLLLLDTNQGFFLERDYLADSFFEASQIADWLRGSASPAVVRARLAERGITHVLIDHGRGWGIVWPEALVALLRDRSHADLRHRSSDGRFELLELR